MASAFTHAFVAVAAGKIYARRPMPWRFWITSVALSILPDLDVLGFAFGIRYQDVLGHRGFSHSIAFALLAGLAALPLFPERSWKLWLYLAIVTATHGFLDAMTDGGLGIAFFSPFITTRYFLPWTPVQVSPIGIAAFFSLWGLAVLWSELLYIWIPASLIVAGCRYFRSQRDRSRRAEEPPGP